MKKLSCTLTIAAIVIGTFVTVDAKFELFRVARKVGSDLSPSARRATVNTTAASLQPILQPAVPTEVPVLIKDIFPGAGTSYLSINGAPAPQPPVEVGGVLYLMADDGTSGRELWRTDGTAPGTFRVKDINPGPAGSGQFPPRLVRVGETIFFNANDGISGPELWRSDGTEAGTFRVKDIFPGSSGSNPRELVNVAGILFFAAQTISGVELWRSDGTVDGTVMVSDIVLGTTSSDPGQLVAVGTYCFFVASDSRGREVWRTDGTASGTFMLKDIFPFSSSSVVSPDSLIDVGGILFFRANDGHAYRLWRTDGTTPGTVKISDHVLPQGPDGLYTTTVALGDTLFFTADHDVDVRGLELWRSDGTEAGTSLVKDIVPGPGWSGPQDLFVFDNAVYFRATDGILGQELWRSDGTDAGTFLVKDCAPGGSGGGPDYFVDVAGTLFFTAADNFGTEIWQSDGTTAGTFRVTDILPSAGSATPQSLGAYGRKLVFMANDVTHGREPWILVLANLPPTLTDDIATVDEDTPTVINVLSNDSDTENDALTVISTTNGIHGSVTINLDGTITYTPAANFSGIDSFTYTVADSEGGTTTATVNVTISPVNDAPVAFDSVVTLSEDTQIEITLGGGDVDNETLSFTLVSQPVNGTLAPLAGNKFLYTPDPNYYGPDVFSFFSNDGTFDSNVATVAIIVAPAADSPLLATIGNQVIAEGSLLSLTLSASDADEGQLMFSVAGLPNGATLDNTTGAFSWTPSSDQSGTYTLTFSVTDPTGRSASETITITVTDVVTNLGPVCSAAHSSVNQIWPPNHRQQFISILGVTDPDNDVLTLMIRRIVQDEPTNTNGDGNTWIDGGGVGTSQAWVRAERSGNKKGAGNGRVYEIFFDASDGWGKSCTGSVRVGVPHDQGHGPAVDDGKRYDSTVAGGSCLNCNP